MAEKKRKTWQEKLEGVRSFPKIIEFSSKLPCAKALEKMGSRPGDSVVMVPPL